VPHLRRSALALILLGLPLAACQADDGTPVSDESDIIGGVDAKSAKLDAIGTVGTKGYDGSYSYFCTATLIAPKIVLTAKHCATYDPAERPRIEEEEIFFAVGADSRAPKQIVRAERVLLSPVNEGGFVKFGSDVAIYVLEAPVEGVKPMPWLGGHLAAEDVGGKYTAVGFGVHDRERNSGIRKAGTLTLNAVSGKPMQAIFPTREELYAHLEEHDGKDWVASNQKRIDEFYDFELLADLEAYLGMGEGDAQPCSGDSGGPLVKKIGEELHVVAVVSGSFKGRAYPCSTVGEAYATLGASVQELIASATGPCEGVPVAGQCEGAGTVLRCVGEDEGPQKINRIDCAGIDQACGVVDGVAQCVDPVE
jgi:hypothetical protein